jgi:hypothetical protein
MSVIKPRTRGKQFVAYHTRLERENHETLHAYAAFIGEDTHYVMNAVIDTVLAKDKEFAAWRTDHAQSFVPTASAAPRRNGPARRVDGARSVVATPGIARSDGRDHVV